MKKQVLCCSALCKRHAETPSIRSKRIPGRRSWEQTLSPASWGPLWAVRPFHPPVLVCAGCSAVPRDASQGKGSSGQPLLCDTAQNTGEQSHAGVAARSRCRAELGIEASPACQAPAPLPRGHAGLVFMVTKSLFAFQPVPLLVSGTVSPSTP